MPMDSATKMILSLINIDNMEKKLEEMNLEELIVFARKMEESKKFWADEAYKKDATIEHLKGLIKKMAEAL